MGIVPYSSGPVQPDVGHFLRDLLFLHLHTFVFLFPPPSNFYFHGFHHLAGQAPSCKPSYICLLHHKWYFDATFVALITESEPRYSPLANGTSCPRHARKRGLREGGYNVQCRHCGPQSCMKHTDAHRTLFRAILSKYRYL